MNVKNIEKYMNLRNLYPEKETKVMTQEPDFNKLIEEARNAGFEAKKLNQHAMAIQDLAFPDQFYYINKGENTIVTYPESEVGPEYEFITKVNKLFEQHLEREARIHKYEIESSNLTNSLTINDYANRVIMDAIVLQETGESQSTVLNDEHGNPVITFNVTMNEQGNPQLEIDSFNGNRDVFKITEQDMKDFEDGNFVLSNLNKQINQKLDFYKNVYERSGREFVLTEQERRELFTCSVGWIERVGQTIERGIDLSSELVSPAVNVARNVTGFLGETFVLNLRGNSFIDIPVNEIGKNIQDGFSAGMTYQRELIEARRILNEAEKTLGGKALENATLLNDIRMKASRDRMLENSSRYAALARHFGRLTATVRNMLHEFANLSRNTAHSAVNKVVEHQFTKMIQKKLEEMKNTFKQMCIAAKELCVSMKDYGKNAAMIGVEKGQKALEDFGNRTEKASVELGKKLNEIHINGQDKMNDFVKNTKLVIDSKEFSKVALAEITHDERRKALIKNTVEDFIPSVMQAQPTWQEQEYVIKEAKNAVKGDGDFEEDLKKLGLGTKAKTQKEIDLIVGEAMSNKIKDIMKSDMTIDDAKDILAKTYNDTMVKAKVSLGQIDIETAKNYEFSKLDSKEQQECEIIAYNTIKKIEPLKDILFRNEQMKEMKQNREERYGNDKSFGNESKTFNDRDLM